MSVFIKGMDKPKNCRVCDFNSSDCFCKINHGKIDRDFWDCDKECPIVEVSAPHGRLIDADKIIKAMNEMKVEGEVFVTAVEYVKLIVGDATTVIEAEGTE